MALAIAWSKANLYDLQDGSHLWGREFQILPSGTMLGAAGVMDGLIGCAAKPISQYKCEIRNGATLLAYGIRQTDTEDLKPYLDELCELFNALQTAQQA